VLECQKNQRVEVKRKFTKLGFRGPTKFKDISPEGWAGIVKFYNEKKDTSYEILEGWDEANIYVNHWEARQTMIHLPHNVKEIIWRDIRKSLGEWANVDPNTLEGSSVYGIRRYWNGSTLANHLDRGNVLVLSAIINVDQGDMQEDWPLEVIDHDLQPHNVFMKPGDCVFYESAVVIHGRPLALKGKYMANVFAHTKPNDWDYEKTSGWND